MAQAFLVNFPSLFWFNNLDHFKMILPKTRETVTNDKKSCDSRQNRASWQVCNKIIPNIALTRLIILLFLLPCFSLPTKNNNYFKYCKIVIIDWNLGFVMYNVLLGLCIKSDLSGLQSQLRRTIYHCLAPWVKNASLRKRLKLHCWKKIVLSSYGCTLRVEMAILMHLSMKINCGNLCFHKWIKLEGAKKHT